MANKDSTEHDVISCPVVVSSSWCRRGDCDGDGKLNDFPAVPAPSQDLGANRLGKRGVGATKARPVLISLIRSGIVESNNRGFGFSA